jgi:hypothetical protein
MRLGLGLGVYEHPIAKGGSFPSWLPTAPSGARPVIYADFKNGHYWGNGAVTDAATLFVHNSNWGGYDPAIDIVPGSGLGGPNTGSTGNPAIDPSFYGTLLTTGFTGVIAWHFDDPTKLLSYFGPLNGIGMTDNAFNNYYDGDCAVTSPLTSNPPGLGFQGQLENPTGNSGDILTSYPSTTNGTFAFNVVFGTQAMSANGSSIITYPSTTPSEPLTIVGITAIYAADNPSFQAPVWMTTAAIYAPQPNTDLPTLST